MKNYPLLLLLFTCSLFFTACGDDDEKDPSPIDSLKGKKWQITVLSALTPLSPTPIDYYAVLQDCQKDNYLEYKDGDVLLLDEGATKCDASMPQQSTGTWKLEGDKLEISGMGTSLGLPINTLDLTIKEKTENSITAEFMGSLSGFPVSGTISMRVMP